MFDALAERMCRLTARGATRAAATLFGIGVAAVAHSASADYAGAQPIDSRATGSSAQSQVSDPLARALAYEHGEGVPRDEKIAAALYCDAAIQGSAEAAFQLGWMYANGRGVVHDDGTAAALFELAASNGHDFARVALRRIGEVHGLLPDCMRPVEPPLEEPQIAEATDDGPDPFDDLPPDKQKIAALVRQLAPRYGVEPRLALAVISVESNFNILAHSVKDARGLMQLVPETAARFNVRNPYNVGENVRGGLAYLRWLLAYYRGEVALAAAAYNAGEGVVDRYRGVPPYPETRDYVRRVLHLFGRDLHSYDPNIVDSSVIAAQSGSTPN